LRVAGFLPRGPVGLSRSAAPTALFLGGTLASDVYVDRSGSDQGSVRPIQRAARGLTCLGLPGWNGMRVVELG